MSARLLNILVITDDDVEAQNRVTLSSFPADEHGPAPKVEFHHRRRSARTLRNCEHVAAKAAQTLRAAGAKKVLRIDWPPLILHVQSTMRMGMAADDSVLDANAEARWVKRLFIADNSALANRGFGPEGVAREILRAVHRDTPVVPVTVEAKAARLLSRISPASLRAAARLDPV